MSVYKINVKGVYLAQVTADTGESLTHGQVEKVGELQEIQVSPKIAEGSLFGDGAKVHTTSKKNSYDISLNLTVLPPKWRAYMEGLKVSNGVESASSSDQPKMFAMGFEVEKTNGKAQKIWYPYCIAKPVEEEVKQSEQNITYSTDKLVVTALEHVAVKRFYTKIDSEIEQVSKDMLDNFFKKVQLTDEITGV